MKRALPALLWTAVALYALLVVHDFFGYVGAYPYLAGDEELGNVSYALATQMRYGDLVLPLQPPFNSPRNRGLFNYGPWYFYLGATLTWLFGYSLTLLRSIHLGVVLFTAVAALAWFRRQGTTVAAALFAIAILHAFDVAHWPMVRPDAMVSAFAVVFIVFAGRAMQTGSVRWWFWAAAAAGCGAFTHLVAWSHVPACAALAALHHLRRDGDARAPSAMATAVALFAGFAVAAVMFYGSFHFRFRDHWTMLSGFHAVVGPRARHALGAPTFGRVLWRHLLVAYDYLSPVGWTGVALSWAATIAMLVLLTRSAWSAWRSALQPVLLPPFVAWSFYVLSLGLYPNFHAGYTILLHVLAFWCAAALLASVARVAEERISRQAVEALIVTVLLPLAVAGCVQKLGSPSVRASLARQWTPIASYVDQVLKPLPQAARAWGTSTLGIETPRRIQMVWFPDGLTALNALPASERAARSPEYVVWGTLEKLGSLFALGPYRRFELRAVTELFPEFRYRPVSLVLAPPYGITRVYERGLAEEPSRRDLPLVSAYDPTRGQWIREIETAVEAGFSDAPPTRLHLSYQGALLDETAQRTLSATLPPGTYLFRVGLRGPASCAGGGMVAATTTATPADDLSELGPGFDIAPYPGFGHQVFLLHPHPGGPVFISQFGRGCDGALDKIETYPLEGLPDARRERGQRPLPSLAGWTPDALSGVRVEPGANGTLLVSGNDSSFGYQIVSPPVPVRPHARVTVRLPVAMDQGTVGVGVLDEAGNWVVPAATLQAEYRFDAGSARAVRLVVANVNREPGSPRKRSRFSLGPGFIADEEEKFYTDLLFDPRR
jgi:hypothetical protein